MEKAFKDFLIRDWVAGDRTNASTLIRSVLEEYGLGWEADASSCCGGADQDAVEVEKYYLEAGGEFWVVEQAGKIVGTGGYHPIERGNNAVEIRKMYLAPEVRGQGLGRFLLSQLEQAIAAKGFSEAWVETATVLKEAVKLYEKNDYHPMSGVETDRCDKVYSKRL
ncbi:MAG: GNAT family N-acetyltransferase [Cyanobacteria bacterium J06643_4]